MCVLLLLHFFFQVATAAAVEYSPPLTPLFIIFTPSLWLEEESFTHAQESGKKVVSQLGFATPSLLLL